MTIRTENKKYTLKEARQILGLTRRELAAQSGISTTAIWRIERGGDTAYKTNDGVATLLANALALNVTEIDWPRGLSHLGRPPLTGKKIIRSVTVTVTEEVYVFCSGCNLALPTSTGVCDTC